MTRYLDREIRIAVTHAMRSMPAVVITGMRQTGKTTFLQNDPIFKPHRYFSLDDFATTRELLPAMRVSSHTTAPKRLNSARSCGLCPSVRF